MTRGTVTTIRTAAVAGSFYPADASTLRSLINNLLDDITETTTAPDQQLRALIVPHAGYLYSGPVAATAYHQLARQCQHIQRIALLGPSHHVYLQCIAAPQADWFATPLGHIKVDQEGLRQLMEQFPRIQFRPDAHVPEHCLEVQLPFLQQTLESFSILPLLIGDIDPGTLLPILERLTDDPQTLVIVSSDLSHYLEYAAAGRLDQATARAIVNLQWVDIKPRQACGATAIQGLLHWAQQLRLQAKILDVRNSGDTSEPRDRVVGYGSFAFTSPKQTLNSQARSALSQIAKQSIQYGLLHQRALPITSFTLPALSQPGASFVTLFARQQLRGCIGSLTAHQSLAEDVAENAFAAAFRDPRFPPLRSAEAGHLSIHLSVLGPPEDLVVNGEAELLQRLQPRVDGLILREGSQHSTFLPSVWEQLPEKIDFLQHLKRKAGLAANYWSPSMQFQRYRTQNWG